LVVMRDNKRLTPRDYEARRAALLGVRERRR
jgi:hypothetical protein